MRGVVDTLVVGAGLSGLAYAHARGPGADLLVLEATDRPGGLVRTTRAQLEHDGALQFEWGPELLPAEAPQLGALLAELKLETRRTPPAAARQLVLHGGRLHPLPTGTLALLSSGLLSWRGKLRALTEPLRPDRSSLDGSGLDGSVADFVRQRLGDEVLQRLADPLVTALYATEPERLSLRATFPELPAMVTEHGSLWGGRRAQQRGTPRVAPRGAAGCTLQGGIAKLTETLARSLGNRLLVNARITSITQEPATFDDPWEAVADLTRHPMVWRVDGQSPKASITEDLCWRARRLVLALPPRAASRMLLPVERTLSERLASISSESIVSLSHAWRRQDVGHRLDAAGFLVPSSESRVQLGTLFSSTIRPGCSTEGVVLLRTLLGGGRNPRAVDWPEEELWGVIMQEVAPVLGLKGQPLWRSVIRQREALPRYDLEHPARREHIAHMLAALPGLSLLGSWNRGHGLEPLVADARALARDHAVLESKDVRIAPALKLRTP
jgi:oxygen-dependent protoporphyrinogen oxidase